MALVSSLFTAITGMRNHQTLLDVISNNVANVNTVGFKAGRVQFRDLLSQTVAGASGSDAANNRGGTNPIQFGTGVAVASIDTSFRQGTLQATGNATDMAINGDGFFISQSGSTRTYTRAGSFRFDSLGRLVDNSGGLIQGWSASANPTDRLSPLTVDSSNPTQIGNITINAGMTQQAHETRNVELVGNLDAGATSANLVNSASLTGTVEQITVTAGNGTGLTTQTFNVGYVELPMTVYDSLGNAHELTMHLQNLSGTAIPGSSSGANTPPLTYDNNTWSWTVDVDPADTTVHLALDNSTFIDPTDPSGTTTIRASSSGLVHFTTNGAMDWVSYGDRNAEHFGTNPAGTAANDPNIPGGVTFPATANTWQAFADADTFDGGAIGFEGATVLAGDYVGDSTSTLATSPFDNPGDGTINFDLSKLPIVLVYQQVPTGSPVPPTGTTAGHLVTVDVANQFAVTGNAAAQQSWYTQWVDIDWGTVSTITAADFDYANTAAPTEGAGVPPSSGDGIQDIFAAGDGVNGHDFMWDPRVTSQNNGLRDGLTQDTTGEFQDIAGVSTYVPRFTAYLRSQDGYTQGILQGISVSADGSIYGSFDNGQTQQLAQVALASFENPAGLAKVGDTTWTPTANSGNPVIGTALSGGRGSVIGGVVEQSNVDLSEELTNMIVAQRGFEVNARLITTSDRILDTLVNLGR